VSRYWATLPDGKALTRDRLGLSFTHVVAVLVKDPRPNHQPNWVIWRWATSPQSADWGRDRALQQLGTDVLQTRIIPTTTRSPR
jgi:hypothetical protein